MLDVIKNIVGSEFLWGTVLGIFLTYIGSLITINSQKKIQQRAVKEFCGEVIENISDFINTLDQFRDRSKTIHSDFLYLIEIEIGAYGRNRDHLIAIADKKLRKKIRSFFVDIAVQHSNVKKHLDFFNRVYADSQKETDSSKKANLETLSTNALNEAHKACDRMVTISDKNRDLIAELI